MGTSEPLEDGTLDFSGGQDASAAPDKLPENCIAAGVNISLKRRVITPRPAFNQLEFTLPEGGVKSPTGRVYPYSNIFKSGRFQALIPYSIGSEYYLIAVISGIIFIINQRTYVVDVIEIADGSHINENLPRVNWSAADRFLVLFDFPARPVIIENTFASRSNPAVYEVPIAVLGSYNQNRLFVANNGNAFTGGDPVGNLATPDAPITFEEVLAPAAAFLGQVFSVTSNYANSPITAMAFLQYTDTSTGIGPLLVATNREIYSYETQNPRVNWEAGSFGRNFIANNGIAGSKAFVNVNSDLFYVSQDGQLRSASMSRDEQRKWSKVPLSREVENWLKYWDKALIPYAVLGYFDNKIMVSANPYRVPSYGVFNNFITDVAYGGLVVIELDNISKLSQDSPPVWSGLWTGIRPTAIVVNDDRCFIASKDNSFVNNIYEVVPGMTIDRIGKVDRQIRSIVYTKGYEFKNQFQDKQLQTADMPFNNVQGNFKVNLSYIPEHSQKPIPWKTFKHYAPVKWCGNPTPCQARGLLGHSFRRLTFGAPPPFICDPVTNETYSVFRSVQLKLIIEGGFWELPGIKIRAISVPDNNLENVCTSNDGVELCNDCNTDWSIPEVDICQT